MCQFKSAIVTANLDVLSNPYTDAHEDLIRLFKLNDTPQIDGSPRFARVEFRPENVEDMADPEKYKLIIDEQREPSWFDDAAKAKVTEKMRILVSGMIIKGDVDMLCGGSYILAKGAKVACVKNALIQIMLGSSSVTTMLGSSSVKEMRGSSSVKEMRGSSSVTTMWDSSSVTTMWDSSSVKEMLGSSSVTTMWDSSSAPKK